MDKNSENNHPKLISSHQSLEELENRLVCAGHVDPLDSAQRKRFIKQFNNHTLPNNIVSYRAKNTTEAK